MGKELCLWLIRYTPYTAACTLLLLLYQTIAKPTSSSLRVEKQREKNLATQLRAEKCPLQSPFFSIIDGLWHQYLAYSFLLTDQ